MRVCQIAMSGQPTATPYAANSFLGTIAPLGKFLSVLGFILIGILGLVGAVTFSLNINDRGRHVYHLPGGKFYRRIIISVAKVER